jgi:hypothetical protein
VTHVTIRLCTRGRSVFFSRDGEMLDEVNYQFTTAMPFGTVPGDAGAETWMPAQPRSEVAFNEPETYGAGL